MRGSRIPVDGVEMVPLDGAPDPLDGSTLHIRMMSERKAHVIVGNWTLRVEGKSVTVNGRPFGPAK